MLAKLSLMSFIYKVIETVYFPNEIVREIYKKHKVKRCLPYHILTDTDSTCLMIVFICDVQHPVVNLEIYFFKLKQKLSLKIDFIDLIFSGRICS